VTGDRLLWWVVPLVVAVDQGTKALAVQVLHHKPGVTVIKGHFKFTYVENSGAAWSILSDLPSPVRVPFFVGVSLVAMASMLYYYRRLEPGARMLRASLALTLGGAIGNFIDRVRNGYVVDFVAWSWGDFRWPRFNVADVAITAGVALMLWAVIAATRRGREAAAPPQI
jgi:lipoprotein signal peptidase